MASSNVSIDQDLDLALYEYQSMDPKDEIRVLVLLPPASSKPDVLSCNLLKEKLTDNPSYEALSYCWGAPIFPETIHLPSGVLEITKNLAAGLRRLRFPNQPRRLWVDAICINQNDDTEKGHQVSLMSRIYRGAKVLVWLGEGNSDTPASIEYMRQLANSAWRYGIAPGDSLGKFLEIINQFREEGNGISQAILQLSNVINYELINNILSQPWFYRLWVLQEFVLASEIEIYNGQHRLEYRDALEVFTILMLILQHSGGGRDVFTNRVNKRVTYPLILWEKERHLNLDSRRDMLHLLQLHSGRLCSLDVDRIYALLALTSGNLGISIRVDYTLSTESVYTNLALYYLEKGNLDILRYTGRTQRYVDFANDDTSKNTNQRPLPSWVPDWRFHSPWEMEIETHRNENSQEPTENPNIHVSIEGADNPAVKLMGIQVDDLKELFSSPWSALDTLFEQAHNAAQMFNQIILGLKDPYPTGEKLEMAIARTIILDNRSFLTSLHLGENISSGDMFELWSWWMDHCQSRDENPFTEPRALQHAGSPSPVASKARSYEEAIRFAIIGRRYFITASGYLGVGPESAESGDAVVIFDGARVPFVLRRVDRENLRSMTDPDVARGIHIHSEQKWKIIGECYVHGWMGKGTLNRDQIKREWFSLV